MSGKRSKPSAYAVFITIMIILLILCIALFVYGSMTNRIPQPVLPGKGLFALRTMLYHG